MYRCTECGREYDICPDYCECGNDIFDEIIEDNYYEEEEIEEPVRPKRKLTREEKEELEQEARDKKKSMIAAIACVILAITVLFLPPYPEKKSDKVQKQVKTANVKLPELKTFWDDTVASPYRKTKDPVLNLPILNQNFASISPQLREYLKEVGGEFNRQWNSALVKGSGECKVEFIINKEGSVTTKRIIASSHNESMDDSVLMALSNVNSFDIPPEDYKGERIFISFKVKEGEGSKIYFPTK